MSLISPIGDFAAELVALVSARRYGIQIHSYDPLHASVGD